MKVTIFWDVTPYSPVKFTDVAEERIACMFSAEEFVSRSVSETETKRTSCREMSSVIDL
jgi:hypothetical protein